MMPGNGAIFASLEGAVDVTLLDRVSVNETYAAYVDSGCSHTDQWAASKRHEFSVDTNFSATNWACLTYDLATLGHDMTDFANVEVRCYSNSVPNNAILDIAVGITNVASTGFNPRPGSSDTSVISFSAGSSISFIYRTLNIDGLANYGASGYDYLWVGYRYRPSGGNPKSMNAWLYDVTLKV